MNTFWDKYYQKPLNEIPWQNTQADWFKELVDRGEISGTSALDLGCGTGKKSIYLALNGDFKKVLGVDISEQAIEYAKTNAQKNKMEKICAFINHDLNKWSFIPKKETLFSEEELRRFFTQFRILSQNTSQPSKLKANSGYYFRELLMQKE